MAKHHRASRKHRSRRHSKARKHSRRHHRRQRQQGGVAPTNYSLAGSWPSQMSLGQGTDFAKYHAAQHGGAAPYPVAVSGAPMLSGAMEGPAMMSGLNKAIADIAGLSDMPGPLPIVAMQKGAGRRKHRRHTKGKKHSRKHSRKHTRRQRRQRRRQQGGGALGFAPVGANPMLLSQAGYNMAGLNPGYISGDVEGKMAALRDRV
jgi:hypothetical protein